MYARERAGYNISHGNHVLLCTTRSGGEPELDDPCLRFFPFWHKFATPLCSRIFRVHKRTQAWHFPYILRKYMHTQINALLFCVFSLGIKADGGLCTVYAYFVCGTDAGDLAQRSESSCSFRSTLKNCLALLFSSSAREERYGFTCNKQWESKISFMEFIRVPFFADGKAFSLHIFTSTLTSIVKGMERRRKEIIPSATFFTRQFLCSSNHVFADFPPRSYFQLSHLSTLKAFANEAFSSIQIENYQAR